MVKLFSLSGREGSSHMCVCVCVCAVVQRMFDVDHEEGQHFVRNLCVSTTTQQPSFSHTRFSCIFRLPSTCTIYKLRKTLIATTSHARTHACTYARTRQRDNDLRLHRDRNQGNQPRLTAPILDTRDRMSSIRSCDFFLSSS